MNNYFDDDQTASNTEPDSDVKVGTLDKGEIDADISKLFSSGTKSPDMVEENSQTPTAPVEEDTKPSDFVTEKVDNNFQSGSDFSPAPKQEETFTSGNASKITGSLAETEAKLKAKKDEFMKQIEDLEEKLKKIDDTLGKISALKSQEEEILKTAEEL